MCCNGIITEQQMGENLHGHKKGFFNSRLIDISRFFGDTKSPARAHILEYAGAGLGVAGWIGVCQVGNAAAQQIGFFIWIAGGLILVGWGYHTRARGIMVINMVNAFMAASAFLALMR